MYSITSQVCSVASGAKETRRFAIDLRRAALRSASSWLGRMPFVATGKADFLLSFKSSFFDAATASSSSSPPGPMLRLRPFLSALRGDDESLRCSGSLDVLGARFSLSSSAMSSNIAHVLASASNTDIVRVETMCGSGGVPQLSPRRKLVFTRWKFDVNRQPNSALARAVASDGKSRQACTKPTQQIQVGSTKTGAEVRLHARHPPTTTQTTSTLIPLIALDIRNHGDRIGSPVRARFSEAAAHLPQFQGPERQDQARWQGWQEMAQGRRSWVQDPKDRH